MTTNGNTPRKRNTPPGEHDGRLNLRLPAAQLDELRREAEQSGETLSERARTLILRGIAEPHTVAVGDDQEADLEERIREHELSR